LLQIFLICSFRECIATLRGAERKLGLMLKEQEKQKPGEHWKEKRLHDETVTPPLEAQGISKVQSHRWQKVGEQQSPTPRRSQALCGERFVSSL
jgi:hypothetical protein